MKHAIGRKGRCPAKRTTKLLVGLAALGAILVGLPAAAGAHAYGHTCSTTSTTGFGCSIGYADLVLNGTDWKMRYIQGFYDGTLRATVSVGVGRSTTENLVEVCDRNADDAIRPRLRARLQPETSDTVIERWAPELGGCNYFYTTSAVKDFRLVYYNMDSPAGITHGTILYAPPSAPPPPAPPPPPPPPPPPSPKRTGPVDLHAGLGCTPSGDKLKVRLRMHRPPGSQRPRVRRVAFRVDRKLMRVDRHAPFAARMRVRFKPGTRHRLTVKVRYRIGEASKTTTLRKRFSMCRR